MAAAKGHHDKDVKVQGHLNMESIKVIAESVGVGGLSDDAANHMSEDCTYRLKQVIQDSLKFVRHGKRKIMTSSDIDQALRAKNVEPLYGLHAPDLVPFRFASGGGRELHFNEEKEIDLQDVLTGHLPKIPIDITLKAHWLSIDGLQPSIPENPPPASKDIQQQEILDTDIKASIEKIPKNKQGKESKTKHKFKGAADVVKLKDLTTHELSVEQQLYYKEITEACVGPDEGRRTEALQSLAADPGLHQMLPRFSTFISEGVKINVVQNNLALLIYLMRMVKSIMDNQSLYLEKYLHEIIPAVCTCIVSKQLCMRPDMDNHWALRDFAARLMSHVCKNFSSSTNNIQARITKTFVTAIQGEKAALATIYGALAGLGEMGAEVVKMFGLNQIKTIGEKAKQALEGPILNSADKIAADNIKKLLTKYISPLLRVLKQNTDTLEEYNNEFGYLGPYLYTAVQRERQQLAMPTSQLRPTIQIAQGKQHIIVQQPGQSMGAPSRFSQGVTVPRTPTTPGAGQQKFVIVTSQARPGTPGAQTITSAVSQTGLGTSTGGPPTIVKVVSASSTSATPTHSSAPPPKIVVMSMPQNVQTTNQSTDSIQVPHDVGMKSLFNG